MTAYSANIKILHYMYYSVFGVWYLSHWLMFYYICYYSYRLVQKGHNARKKNFFFDKQGQNLVTFLVPFSNPISMIIMVDKLNSLISNNTVVSNFNYDFLFNQKSLNTFQIIFLSTWILLITYYHRIPSFHQTCCGYCCLFWFLFCTLLKRLVKNT